VGLGAAGDRTEAPDRSDHELEPAIPARRSAGAGKLHPGHQGRVRRRGLQLLVDGADPERIRELLEVEINTFEDEWRQAAKIWEAAGGYSPTIGILGAVMGLIHVMENLSDPTKLGAGIAVAFVATIYGVGLANLVYLPIAGKLKYYISRMVATREMLVDGLVGIAVGDNPRIIEGRLRGYLH
jgi:chemotaxis protein MotA